MDMIFKIWGSSKNSFFDFLLSKMVIFLSNDSTQEGKFIANPRKQLRGL